MVDIVNLKRRIGKSFDASSLTYEKSALIQKEIGHRLFSRLDYLKINPKRVLDLGCGTGYFTRLLQERYPQAEIYSLDLSLGMLTQHKDSSVTVLGDMHTLPFADGSFDLVFSNQTLHWAISMNQVIRELNRVMAVNACLMFSTLGPDSLCEIKKAWALVDAFKHTNDFIDMHDIGDWLLQEQFVDPVMDMEKISMRFSSLESLLYSLKDQGVKNINPGQSRGLMGKANWQKFIAGFPRLDGKFPLTYEVIYGHTWKGMKRQSAEGMETLIPISGIRRKQD